MPTPVEHEISEEFASEIERGADLIHQWSTVDAKQTDRLKAIAAVVVNIRSHTMTADGPDWAGRTNRYRQVMHAMYARSGIEADSVSALQSALRYHIGNRLREVVSKEELGRVGISTESPRDRARLSAAAAALEQLAAKGLPKSVPSAMRDQATHDLLASATREVRRLSKRATLSTEIRDALSKLESALSKID